MNGESAPHGDESTNQLDDEVIPPGLREQATGPDHAGTAVPAPPEPAPHGGDDGDGESRLRAVYAGEASPKDESDESDESEAGMGADDWTAHRPVGAAASHPSHAGPDELFEPADLPPLQAALEAVLLVTDEPVPSVTLAQVVERPRDEVEAVLAQLAAEYVQHGRGFELRAVAGGWRLYTRPDCAPYVERFVLDGQQARLTQAALETLAVIAYRQPVTRARVAAVRGVNVDGVVRTLTARGLVVEAGQDGETGGTLYRTTSVLLEKLGLQSLEELPSLAPLLPELADVELHSTST